ncbi:hypothetical protein ACCS96_01905, partial [Rhizobium ruizarguesonis]
AKAEGRGLAAGRDIVHVRHPLILLLEEIWLDVTVARSVGNREGAVLPACHFRYLVEVARIRRRKVHQNGADPIDFCLRR